METKEKILAAALELFSQRGYEAVSVREIAGEVGIKESSLYNHFQNKRDIFDSLVDVCWQKAEAYYRSKQIPFTPEEDLSVFGEWDFSKLAKTIGNTFRYFFEDPWNVRFRRLLILSQYTDQRAAGLYQKLYRDYPLAIQTAVFRGLMEAGQFQKSDPEAAALDFYGTVFLLMHTCPSWAAAEPQLMAHLKQFVTHHRAAPEARGKAEQL